MLYKQLVCGTGPNFADIYHIRVALLNDEKTEMCVWERDGQASESWQTIEHLFQGYVEL